jgi:hypothetical protein
VIETTNGSSSGHHGVAHDPFASLPGSEPAKTTATAESSTSSARSSSSAGGGEAASTKPSSGSAPSGGSSGSGSTTSKIFTPSKPSKPKTVYKVALQFGALPAGVAPANAELTAYAGLTKATPLPSAKEKLIEFVGVAKTASGKSASFSVTGEVILHGQGSCLPSPSQCQVIDLKPGKAEQLEYLSPAGTLVTYELRVVSITSTSASAAAVAKIARVDARAASRLFVVGGAFALSGLRFSSQTGVLVFGSHGASAARAHAAVQHAHAAAR